MGRHPNPLPHFESVKVWYAHGSLRSPCAIMVNFSIISARIFSFKTISDISVERAFRIWFRKNILSFGRGLKIELKIIFFSFLLALWQEFTRIINPQLQLLKLNEHLNNSLNEIYSCNCYICFRNYDVTR